MVRRPARFSRSLAVALVALVAYGFAAPIAAASAHHSGFLRGQGSGLGNPSLDSTAPQIPAGANVGIVRAWIERAIALRLLALRSADSAALARAALTSTDRSLLLAQIFNDQKGLGALATGVRSETSTTELQYSIDSMITDYRVFSVVVPQVKVTIDVDAYEAAVVQLMGTEAEISAAVTTAGALGNSNAAQRYYSALVAEVQAAGSLLQTAHTALVSTIPLPYPGAMQVISSAHGAVSSARADIRAARADIEVIVRLLRKRLGTKALTIP